jgi:hypothetical protein
MILWLSPVISFSNCLLPPAGQVVKIEVAACEEIVADTNKEVTEFAGDLSSARNLRKAYTGALVTDKYGTRWMYPSQLKHSCTQFRNKTTVAKKAYHTCCDTGRWGKCVFGGQWLGDIAGKPINAFQ